MSQRTKERSNREKSIMRAAILALAAIGGLLASASAASAQQAYCDSIARNFADQNAGGGPAGGAILGGTMGAVGGAILGGIIDGNRGAANGAAIGGAGGALAGAGGGQNRWNAFYNQAYSDCMARNAAATRPIPPPPPGYRPAPPPPPGAYTVPPRHGAPPAWSRAWYDYCAARYRTFDPNTGYFVASGGVRKFCR